MKDWKVARGDRACSETGRAFEPGEMYYSALCEEGESFRRLDFSQEAWERVDSTGFFSFWKTRLPEQTEEEASPRRMVDTEVIYTVFGHLADAQSVEKLTFRYLLALILVRKRRLRLDDIRREGSAEVLEVWDRRLGTSVTVMNPEATPAALETAQRELAVIFDMDLDDAADIGPGIAAQGHEEPSPQGSGADAEMSTGASSAKAGSDQPESEGGEFAAGECEQAAPAAQAKQ